MAEGGGDSTVLSRLREESASLCRVSVSGTGGYTASSGVDIDIVLRLREQLKQQKFDVRNRINAGDITVHELEYITEENLKEAIRGLVLEIENAKVAHCNKSLLLQRMQIFHNIQSKLQGKDSDSVFLTETTNHAFAVASLILKEQKETRALEKEIVELKQNRITLKDKSAKLMAEILSIVDEIELQKEPKEKKLKKVFRYVQKETDATFMIQNIFQRIVHASCVNWAADPKLREAVIKAGKDLHSF